jgi:hypothetical protein
VTDPIQRRGQPLEALAVAAASLVVLQLLIWWLDNVHINTTNGMFKSLTVRQWMLDPANTTLDRSNYLHFPLMAVLCRLLDLLSVHVGQPWKQLAIINAAFGATCLGIVFAFVRALTGRRDIALLATLLHGASAFFLILSISNEDILPGYTLVLAAMALAALWFDRPTMQRVAVVGALFTLGWLFEWRLLFPTLPALVLALVVSDSAPRQRAIHLGALVLSILLTAETVALFWDGHNGSGQIHQLLWVAKGIDSGWAGFSSDKFALAAIGVGQYLLGGRNPASASNFAYTGELLVSLGSQIVLLTAMATYGWRRRNDPRTRVMLAVFAGTFVAGEVFNLYSQPQDPQMQINVMPWLTVAWAVTLLGFLPGGASVLWRGTALAIPLAVFGYNASVLSDVRGNDGAQIALLGELEQITDPDSTVFLYHGFETTISWQNLLWAWRWTGACDLPTAPASQPKFKWIGVNHTLIQKPRLSTAEHAQQLRQEIDCALTKGYRVLTSSMWDLPPEEFASRFVTLNAAHHAPALQKLFHDNYLAVPAFSTPQTGPYLEVRRR